MARASTPDTGDLSELVELGEVMGAHGIRGELKVKLHNPESELLLEVDEVLLCVPGSDAPERAEIRHAKIHGKGLLMSLSGVNDREQARALYGAQLCLPRGALPEPEADEFYLVDAIGAVAVDPDGNQVGEVTAFRAYPTADVLCVQGPDGVREVPVLPPYFLGAEPEQGRVVVDHLEDLEIEPVPRKSR